MPMPFNEFADMMRRINQVSPGDHEKFAEDVIANVSRKDGVKPKTLLSSNDVKESIRLQRHQVTDGASGAHVASFQPAVVQTDSGFKFGAASQKELVGVDERLVRVARLALKYSLQDFCVYDGIRTVKEQAEHVRRGTSKTMQSKHLQGLAVDLVPWINGKPVWDWDGCYKIAMAVDRAATELGFANLITWGGAWDRRLSDFGGDASAYAREVQLYKERHAGPDFIDGPHFEIQKAN